jgi:hypothetical protein
VSDLDREVPLEAGDGLVLVDLHGYPPPLM